MPTINPIKSGLVFGMLMGAWHFLWATLVAFGWAQTVINFIFWIHFITPIYIIQPFHLGVALALIAITTSIGFVVGYVFAQLWNWLHR
jgi:hypothetical protein